MAPIWRTAAPTPWTLDLRPQLWSPRVARWELRGGGLSPWIRQFWGTAGRALPVHTERLKGHEIQSDSISLECLRAAAYEKAAAVADDTDKRVWAARSAQGSNMINWSDYQKYEANIIWRLKIFLCCRLLFWSTHVEILLSWFGRVEVSNRERITKHRTFSCSWARELARFQDYWTKNI